jgi:hypothetical protein
VIDVASEIVNAIASSAGNSLGAKGAEAAARMISALRAKLRRDPVSRGALEIAVEAPAEPAALESLVSLLRERAAKDTEFGAWLAGLWAEVRPDLQAGESTTVNVIGGTVYGNVVQARDIEGGVHFGDGR